MKINLNLSPRHTIANALLCFQYAVRPNTSIEQANEAKNQGKTFIQETLKNPQFVTFLEEIDRFDKNSDLSTELTETALTKDTCNVAHWDGTKMCLLRIARENPSHLEREKAFELFRTELEECCAITNHLSESQWGALKIFIELLGPQADLKKEIKEIWARRKAVSPCSY